MSSKRKTTKPIRVSCENGQNDFVEIASYDFTSTGCDFSLNEPSNETIDFDPTKTVSKWQLSLPKDSLSLPTMVNPSSFTNYKWSLNSEFTNFSTGSGNPSLLTSGDVNDSPSKKTRKIRYKYKESANTDVRYKCEVCQYCTNRSDHYKRHLITHSDQKPLVTNPSTGSGNPSLLTSGDVNDSPPKKTRKIRYKYKESANTDVRYKCEVCQYCTNRSDHYKRHLITHSDEKPLKCYKCGYGTGRSDHFRRHLSRHGLSEEDILKQCEINGIKTGHRGRNHNGQLRDSDNLAFQLKCSTDDSATSTPSNDVVSIVTRTLPKRYTCDLCGYSTDRLSHYSRHVKIHSEEKPFRCDSCGKEFKLDSYLKKHRCSKKAKSCSLTPNEHLLDALDCFIRTSQPPTVNDSGFPSSHMQLPLVCTSSGAGFDSLGDVSDMFGDF